jgi:hypothetical protein
VENERAFSVGRKLTPSVFESSVDGFVLNMLLDCETEFEKILLDGAILLLKVILGANWFDASLPNPDDVFEVTEAAVVPNMPEPKVPELLELFYPSTSLQSFRHVFHHNNHNKVSYASYKLTKR